MYERSYVVSSDGNVSVRLDDDRILATPTMTCKGRMTEDLIAITDIEGKALNDRKASSELAMHLLIYRERPDVKAVCHAHPPHGTAFAVAGLTGNDAGAPQADHQSSTTADTSAAVGAPVRGQTTELTVDLNARCAQPTAELLAQFDQAFEGTVTAIEGDTVTLQTTDVYNGQVGETVVVTAPAGMDKLIGLVHFKVGGTYLVSAYQGSVSLCGYTGPATGELRSLFQKAFVH